LTRLLLTQDVAVASAYIEAIRSQRATLGSLYLSLLAPAAQLVGNSWRNDQCGFNEVVFVLSRLQQLLREFTPPADAQTH
jgi:MerR family transcriptional regulator, light-induced transcriptional regulator